MLSLVHLCPTLIGFSSSSSFCPPPPSILPPPLCMTEVCDSWLRINRGMMDLRQNRSPPARRLSLCHSVSPPCCLLSIVRNDVDSSLQTCSSFGPYHFSFTNHILFSSCFHHSFPLTFTLIQPSFFHRLHFPSSISSTFVLDILVPSITKCLSVCPNDKQ